MRSVHATCRPSLMAYSWPSYTAECNPMLRPLPVGPSPAHLPAYLSLLPRRERGVSAENSEPILLFFLPSLPSDSDRGGSATAALGGSASPPLGPGPVAAVVGPSALVSSAAAPGSGVGAVSVAGTGSCCGALAGCGSAAGVSSSCLASASAGGVASPPRASAFCCTAAHSATCGARPTWWWVEEEATHPRRARQATNGVGRGGRGWGWGWGWWGEGGGGEGVMEAID